MIATSAKPPPPMKLEVILSFLQHAADTLEINNI